MRVAYILGHNVMEVRDVEDLSISWTEMSIH